MWSKSVFIPSWIVCFASFIFVCSGIETPERLVDLPQFQDVLIGAEHFNPHRFPLSVNGFFMCKNLSSRQRQLCRDARAKQKFAASLLGGVSSAVANQSECWYEGKKYPAGSGLDIISYKCYFAKCVAGETGVAQVQLMYLDDVGCCRKGNNLYLPGGVIKASNGSRKTCVNGTWTEQ